MTAAATPSKAGMPFSPLSSPRVHSGSATSPASRHSRTSSTADLKTPKSSHALSPHAARPLQASSPAYFEYQTDSGLNPLDSNAGTHTRKNWSSGGRTSAVTTPAEPQPCFESFRRQSETNPFRLSHGNLRQFSSSSTGTVPSSIEAVPSKSDRRRDGPSGAQEQVQSGKHTAEEERAMDLEPPSAPADLPQPSTTISKPMLPQRPQMTESPANSQSDLSTLTAQLTHVDERHPRNSLPHIRHVPIPSTIQRAETLPSSTSTRGPEMLSPQHLNMILTEYPLTDYLLLDLRVFKHYSSSKIRGAINLNLPSTLLKRASYNVEKLAQCFAHKEEEKTKFNQWRNTKAIIVYDESSSQMKEAAACVSMLKKFTSEDWHGTPFIVCGGFNAFAKTCPNQVERGSQGDRDSSGVQKLSIDPPAAAPVAGGCLMPEAKTAANPFFNTIRQNMDLIGGVGQLPIKLPPDLRKSAFVDLPSWLREVADVEDNGRTSSARFLGIEKAEQKRMQKALSTNVSYGTPNPLSPTNVQIAGIEKGIKNRYKDILPFEHSRVKIQNVPFGGCDYINASHIKAEYSHKHYLATQAPVPATFQDFWRIAWEQKVRVIVMLTAETEAGNIKSHNYWNSTVHGPFKVKNLSERVVSLELDKDKLNRSFTTPLSSGARDERPGIGRRRSTNHGGPAPTPQPSSHGDPDSPTLIIRKLTLAHTQQPFEPLREITQMQYSHWPDFGVMPPSHVLALVEQCNSIVRSCEPTRYSHGPDRPAEEGERPIIVHCSAGCGRTGTFCTVDSVLDILKRQKAFASRRQKSEDGVHDAMEIDLPVQDTWLERDDTDLVAKTVSDFRLQRLSMVQTLLQFVLCYETVLEWVVSGMPDKGRVAPGDERKSWAG